MEILKKMFLIIFQILSNVEMGQTSNQEQNLF